jgi:phenylalanyl-tRNA synthetase beta chain
MRTTLLGGLLEVARSNLSRGAERVALFESGRVYLAEDAPTDGQGPLAGEFVGRHPAPAREPHRLGCLLAGEPSRSWRQQPAALDYFAAKGLLESLFAQVSLELEVEPADEPFLHAGRSAAILIDGRREGWIGEVHPLVARSWDLEGAVGFELDLAPLVEASPAGRERYEDVTTFPAVYEDIAVVVPEDVPARRLREVVLAGGGELLVSAEVFDLYRGEQVGEGQKSLALRLAFRAPDRTLTDDEVAERREAIKAALGEVKGSLRE